MPIGRYKCENCGYEFKLFQMGVGLPDQIECEKCGGTCKRLPPSSVGIKFNASGFYSTENKKPSDYGN